MFKNYFMSKIIFYCLTLSDLTQLINLLLSTLDKKLFYTKILFLDILKLLDKKQLTLLSSGKKNKKMQGQHFLPQPKGNLL